MRKFRSTRFSFIFKGRSVDFHRHMKKKSYKIIWDKLFYGYSISGNCEKIVLKL